MSDNDPTFNFLISMVYYKGTKTVEEIKRGVNCLVEMGELLGKENLLYRCAIDGIDEKMNMEIEVYLADPRSYEAMVAEATMQCILSGYYVDIADIEKSFISDHFKSYVSEFAKKHQQ